MKTKKFAELRAKMSPEAAAESTKLYHEAVSTMPLNELRSARGLTQEMLAEMLHVQQPAVAKLERRTDMYISTLRSHIKAMGGELDIVAHFPDGDVRISNFSQINAQV
jgi:predicted XRE-type DNA-binding protein